MIRAVIDTNILLQGLTRKGVAGQIIDAWVDRVFLPCVSTALALEYEEILKRRFPQNRYPHIELALQALLDRAGRSSSLYISGIGQYLQIQEMIC